MSATRPFASEAGHSRRHGGPPVGQRKEKGSSMSSRSVVAITGASAGVGRATARVFAESGFDVALLARGAAGLEAAAKEVQATGGRALVVPTDVSSFDQVDAAATQVEAELGPLDVWVNDAMTTVFAPSWEVRPADFQRAVEVTFRARSGERRRPWPACGPATGAGSSTSARPWPSSAFPSRRPTARPSSPVEASSSRPAPSCSTKVAT